MGGWWSSQTHDAVNVAAVGLRGCKSLTAHMIKKIGSKYVVVVENDRHMGIHNTKGEPKKRLQQIEFFKHPKSSPKLRVGLKKKSLLK